LRDWWRAARKKGWMAPGQPWLFPGYRAQHMSARQLHRLVRPAAARRHHAICIVIITGWAQVSGLRGEVDTLERAHARVAHDRYYIEHWSPWLDLKILLKTVGNSCLA
jgi:putative colanic acid biosynthesis UDP-glucose lipid carrier transferase